MLIQEAIERFLADLATEGRSGHTIAAYRRDLETFSRYAGNPNIDTITPALLTQFMASDNVQVGPCGAPRAKATINRYRVALKALFAWCEARWLVPRNPTTILRCQRHRSLPPEILTKQEIAHLVGFEFAGRWAERDRSLIVFLLSTGCRLGETAALDIRDIDWDAGRITLRRPKGGEPDQIVLSETAQMALRPLVTGTSVGHAVFRTSSGRRLSTRQIQRIVARRCQEAGITKPVTPHTLRHTFATRLYNATRDVRLVQRALRHTFITTTQIYAQVDPVRLQAAISDISRA